ncbi:hypothetical protein FNV43_RR02035 [Rhamnella rubrinervis]|uniref:Uncharacterized protein n=1 Tax=Rhamnella rubrinervis TaxID=2594499 RepID=A0A8K0HT95_9ROSA|nr:hypothetical protein FNV43_RR02035 [Rhamnella rubrinervis]
MLGELKNLKILDLTGSYIEELPKEIGQLTRLRLLDLKDCLELKVIHPNTISSLRSLQELNMKGSFTNWKEVGRNGDRSNDLNNVVQELDVEGFPQLKHLHFKHNHGIQYIVNSMEDDHTRGAFVSLEVTFPKLQNLTLRGSPTLNELWHGQSEDLLCDEEPACLFSGLKGLTVFELPNLIHIWDKKHRHTNGSASLNLKYLHVSKCNGLKNLAPSWISFQNLIFLEVSKCNEMVNLLTLSTAKSLTQLRMMSVVGCKSMTEIIEDKGSELGGHDDRIVFDHLLALKLHGLLSLTSFYSGKSTVGFPKLKHVSFARCPNLRSFSHGVVSTPELHKIVLLHGGQDDDELYNSGGEFSSSDVDMDWPVTDKELDFDALDALDDFGNEDDGKPVVELMDADINNTLSQMWERNQIGLALQQ